MVQVLEIQKRAVAAYLEVLREQPTGWTSPPAMMKDKVWSRKLREIWPECTTVYMDHRFKPRYSEARTWCNEQVGSYWCSANGDAWYFENHKEAVLFKLTFGGDQ